MKVFTIWRDPEGDLTMVQGTNSPRFVNGDEQSPGCVMVHQFEAGGLEEAVGVLHRLHEQQGKGSEQ